MGFQFFLYGVYDVGQKCHGRFQNIISQVRPAYTQGALYQLDCGLRFLRPEGTEVVSGHLVELNIAESHWDIIDVMNGFDSKCAKKSLLSREVITVWQQEGGSLAAQAYCLHPEKTHVAQLVHSENAVIAPLMDQLTERQQTYLKKLSQAKGREIVPVDMALYRELMSLELIVDKGRRLALTSLGQEVSHFL